MADVVHVCSAHAANDSRVFHHECVSLARRGYATHLIAGDPSHISYVNDGVVIHPLRQATTRFAHIRRRWHVAKMAAALAPRLFHVHEPSLLGPVLSVAGHRPVIYDAHESYQHLIREEWTWIPGFLRPLVSQCWKLMEQRNGKRTAAIITVTPQIAANLREYHANVHVVANYPPSVDWRPPAVRRAHSNTCVYTGQIKQLDGIDMAIRAVAILRGRGVDIRLRLAGPTAPKGFLEKLLGLADQLGVGSEVEYCGVINKAAVMELLHGSLCGIALRQRTTNGCIGIPRKQIEYMAAGLAVIGPNYGNCCKILEEAGAGIPVDPARPEEIAAAIERLVRDPELAVRLGNAGREAVAREFNWESQEQRLFAIYEKLIGPASASFPA